LPERIAALEAEQKQVQADLADPKLYASDAAKVAQLHARDLAIESELMQALERWELLSA
jgi:ABC transport system ATP-binding/permease protein